jgi:thiamine-phosphate pyrophosphorylase
MNRADVRLCAILDAQRHEEHDIAQLVATLAGEGCTMIVLSPCSPARRAVEQVRACVAALAGRGTALVVAHRADLAGAAGADGVVLSQDDMHPNDARRLLGPDRLIWLAIDTPESADELFRLPVDWAAIGDIFGEVPSPLDLDHLARLAFRAHLAAGAAVCAVQGFDFVESARLVGAGADGMALGAGRLLAARDPDDPRWLRSGIDVALASRGQA